jgi:hypothetical protein
MATSPTIDYPARTSVLEGPRIYRLQHDALHVMRQTTKPVAGAPPAMPLVIPFPAITRIRLRYFPTRVQRNRFECIVTTRTFGEFKITNEGYKGFLQFEDQSAGYRVFVTELCRRVAVAAPQATFVRGRALVVYLIEHAFLLGALIALGFVLWTLGGALRGLVLVKLAIIAFYLPTVVRYAWRSLPAPFDPLNVPSEILPVIG